MSKQDDKNRKLLEEARMADLLSLQAKVRKARDLALALALEPEFIADLENALSMAALYVGREPTRRKGSIKNHGRITSPRHSRAVR